jgi:hypothetical protein
MATAIREIQMEDLLFYYQLEVACNNCDLKEKLFFIKGVLVKEHNCPKCGTRSFWAYYQCTENSDSPISGEHINK